LKRLIRSSSGTVQAVLEGCVFFLAFAGTIKFHRIQFAAPGFDLNSSALMFALLMVTIGTALGLYKGNRSLAFGAIFSRMVFAVLLASLLTYVTFDRLGYGMLFQSAVGGIALCALGGAIVARHVLDLFVRHAASDNRVLVLGTGKDALRIEQMSVRVGQRPPSIVGFYPAGPAEKRAVPVSRVLAVSTLCQAVACTRADELVIAVSEQRGGALPVNELLACRLAGVRVTSLTSFYERVHGRIPVDSLKTSWLIYGDGFRQSWPRKAVKSAIDFVVASILLAVALPVILCAVLAIMVETGGPILYRQERVGAGGRTFVMLKFRSMVQDAERDGVARWAAQDDQRVTKVGQFIRRTRIDEVPQLVNVLRGEMSLVGPRPERPQFVDVLGQRIPFYAVRHAVKPGITGWAQTRWKYCASIDESALKLEYDLYYVKNHTSLLDMRILLETVAVVLSGRGAR